MTSRDFAYWLQGFFELNNPKTLNATQTKLIQAHLNMVFEHEIDPSMGDEEHREKLHAAHNGMTAEQVAELKTRLKEVEQKADAATIVARNARNRDPFGGRIMC